MKTILSKNIFTKKDIINIIVNEINNLSLYNYVTNIRLDNSVLFSRYYYDKKLIIFNYDNIYKYFINLYDDIEYINIGFMFVIYHEIKHIIQYISNDKYLYYANIREEYLKKNNSYNNYLYRINPIERQANIYSLSKCILDIDISNINYYKCMLKNMIMYGYSLNNYPIKKFLDKNNIIMLYNNIIDLDKKIEYGCYLNNEEMNKVRRMVI